MRDRLHGERCGARRAGSTTRRHPSRPLVLWRLRGATDDLRGLAVETSFGYALGLELDAELVLLHLQPSLESLIAYADRIESALLAQGWQVIDAPAAEGSRHVAR